MTDKLVAIVRFKYLRKQGISPDTRFAAFEAPTGLCGPTGAVTSCAFWNNIPACNKVCCEDAVTDVYFKEIPDL